MARFVSLAAALLLAACGGSGTTAAPDVDEEPVENTFDLCQDEVDNDRDGATDCEDHDCHVLIVCAPSPPIGVADAADGAPLDTGAPDASAANDVPPAADRLVADLPPLACDPCGNGSLRGLVCAPSQQVYVSQAHITVQTVDCDGAPLLVEGWSQPDGVYVLPEVPCGTWTVVVEKGSFRTEYSATIAPGQLTDISGTDYKLCFGADAVRIAALWGQWDEMHLILERLGFTYDWYEFSDELYMDPSPWEEVEAVQLLRDSAALAVYDILFLNCGSAYQDWAQKFPEMFQNLRDWVAAGGSLYATDLAWIMVERAWPDAIDFYGRDTEGRMSCEGPQVILGNHDHPVTVLDADLAAYLGGTTERSLHYGPGPLISIAAALPPAVVHAAAHIVQQRNFFTGDDPCVPLDESQPVIVSFTPSTGGGRVIYTTFHNDEQEDQEAYDQILFYLTFLL